MRWALSSPGACKAIKAIESPSRYRRARARAGYIKRLTGRWDSKVEPSRGILSRTHNQLPGGGMATKLEKTLKREITIDGKAYMVAISPEGVKVTQKGFRRGPELTWRAIISGEAEMGQQLKSSVGGTGGDSEE